MKQKKDTIIKLVIIIWIVAAYTNFYVFLLKGEYFNKGLSKILGLLK